MNLIYIEVEGNNVTVTDSYGSGIIELETIPDSDLDLLQMIWDNVVDDDDFEAKNAKAILEYAEEHGKGIVIRDTTYKYTEVRSCFV